LKVLVIIGPDAPQDQLAIPRIEGATGVKVYQNQYPPEGKSGIVLLDAAKTPDFEWPDYLLTVGNVETGRHKPVEQILHPTDLSGHLISLLEAWESETDADE